MKRIAKTFMLSTALLSTFAIAAAPVALPCGDAVLVSAPACGSGPPVVTPPTPPVGQISCPGFAKTLVIPLDWANANIRVLTSSYGGFGVTDAVVMRFTTGNVSTTNNLPHIDAVEYQGTASSRTATLSATPCDFSRQTAPGANINGNTVGAIFAIGTGTGYGYYPVLQTNTTYYLNIKNDPGAGCSWNNACNMGIALFKPGGL